MGFIAAGVVVYIMGSQTQVGWLYMIDAVIWSMLLLSALLPWWSLRSLHVERQVWLPRNADWPQGPATPMEDQVVEVKIAVHNLGRLARNLVKVVDDCPFDDPAKGPRTFLLSTIKPKSTTAFTYTATCFRRGRYAAATAVLETSAPLGLFVFRRRYSLPLNLTVYPVQLEMEAVPTASEVWADVGQKVKSSSGSEFYGSREYQSGDSLRRIHWRNTARRGQFMVKELEESSQGTVLVAFENRQEWGEGRETTFEYSIRIAASLARQCGSSGRGVGILVPPRPVPIANWLDAMDYLTGLTLGGTNSLHELTDQAEAGQILVAIVPASAPELVPSLSSLAARDVSVVVVLLEGFAESDTPHEFSSQLNGTGIGLIRCSRGNLGAAVDELGHYLQVSGQQVRTVS